MKVELSKSSKDLIFEYSSQRWEQINSIDSESQDDFALLISWLKNQIDVPSDKLKKSREESEFILASLHAELLSDLYSAMMIERLKTKKEEEPTWSAKFKFLFLAIAGTLVAGCQGFDSVTTLLGVLSLPSVAVLIAGLVFSTISILVFYGFDLVQVSKNLGVRFLDAPKLLDVYLLQLEKIKAIRKKISTYTLSELSPEELERLQQIMSMLRVRFNALTQASKQYDQALNSTNMQIAKFVFSSMAGILFFGSGFFAGQSVAIFMLGLFMTSVTPTFWPVIVFSLIVGVAAFSLYWYVEQVGLKKLVSGLFGLDEEKIDLLCDDANLSKENQKLRNLEKNVVGISGLKREYSKTTPLFSKEDSEITHPKTIQLNIIPSFYSTRSSNERTDSKFLNSKSI